MAANTNGGSGGAVSAAQQQPPHLHRPGARGGRDGAAVRALAAALGVERGVLRWVRQQWSELGHVQGGRQGRHQCTGRHSRRKRGVLRWGERGMQSGWRPGAGCCLGVLSHASVCSSRPPACHAGSVFSKQPSARGTVGPWPPALMCRARCAPPARESCTHLQHQAHSGAGGHLLGGLHIAVLPALGGWGGKEQACGSEGSAGEQGSCRRWGCLRAAVLPAQVEGCFADGGHTS